MLVDILGEVLGLIDSDGLIDWLTDWEAEGDLDGLNDGLTDGEEELSSA